MTNQSKEAMDVRSPEWTAECDHGECFGGRCFYQSKEEGSFSGGAGQMRAAFMAWVQDQGCDTDGAWSAWQGCWNLLFPTCGAPEECPMCLPHEKCAPSSSQSEAR